ncbi:hypothetical protein AGMMS49965_01940 [Bacteroidia bacterium]|nr:hypothetical protein AGMMS49965_01940 [Bacteroidia bacterium]
MKKKNFFSFCAAAALLLGTGAANAQESWNIGSPTSTDVVATRDGTTLTITGTGAMADYAYVGRGDQWTSSPWSNAHLETLVINEGVTNIGDYAFYDKFIPGALTIPNSVKSIGKEAFLGCNRLTSVTIGNSVKSIGERAFQQCGFRSVTIPNSVTSIGKEAFKFCHYLTSVTIGNSVKSIEDDTFADCDRLTSVTIGNSVKRIGYGAFFSCESLTSVTIPNSVTSIGEEAFRGCIGLTSVTCLAATPPSLGQNFTVADTLYVPKSALNTYKNNKKWSSAFDIILAIESATSVKTEQR